MKKKYTNTARRKTPLRRTRSHKHMSLRGMMRLSHGMVFGLTLFSFFAAYLFVVNDAAIKGTEIRTLERRIAVLEETFEERALEEAQLRSLAYPEESDTLESVTADEIRIIAVAKNRKDVSAQKEHGNIVVAVVE